MNEVALSKFLKEATCWYSEISEGAISDIYEAGYKQAQEDAAAKFKSSCEFEEANT